MSEEYNRGERLKNPGYVYILQSGDKLKIGQSVNPVERKDKLNRTAYGSRKNWEIIDSFETAWMLQVEQKVHMELWDFRVRKEIYGCSIEFAKTCIIKSIKAVNERFGQCPSA